MREKTTLVSLDKAAARAQARHFRRAMLHALRITLACLVSCALGGIAMAAAPKYATSGRTGPALSDQQFFDALDLDRPDLAAVKAPATKSDWPAAKHAFVEHIKGRTTPQWTFDWKQRGKTKPHANLIDADRYARNMLQSCSVWEDFKDKIDWNANPMPNQYAEWTWQLSRHPFWVRLGEAYWATGDEKYAKAFVAQMSDWVRKQPVPDDSGNYAYSAWRTIETGIRMFGTWPDSFYYFLSSPSFDDESTIMMIKSFHDHAEHLMKFPTSGNWLAGVFPTYWPDVPK